MTELRVRWFWMVGMAVLFALAHTQAPYIWSNQNQYYLHGAAAAGYGDLVNDWLANTRDPAIVFSTLVEIAFGFENPSLLSCLYFVILMTYFLTLDRLLAWLFGFGGRRRWVVMAAILVLHSAALRLSSVQVLGVDYPWYLQAGVAGQYMLGPGLQPSVFQIGMLSGMAAFASQRFRQSAAAAMAAFLHPGSLLPGLLCFCGFQMELALRRRFRAAIELGLVSSLFGGAALALIWMAVQPSDKETFAKAQEILVHFRLPHHCRIDRWLDWIAVMQILVMGVGCFLTRQTLVFRPVVFVISAAILLSAFQWWTQSESLALLCPWRVSVVLMPMSVAVILDRLIVGRFDPSTKYSDISIQPPVAVIGVAAAFAAFGIWISCSGIGYYINHNEDGIINYVLKNRGRGEVYMVPVRIPNLLTTPRGSVSLTFAQPRPADHGIPPDFQRFRLATGAPVYVDFKSIPYADKEVLEWYRRLQGCVDFYQSNDQERAVDRLISERVTHVVVPAELTIRPVRMELLYEDEYYRLYRLAAKE